MIIPWYVLLIAICVGIVQIAVGVAIGRLLPVTTSGKPGVGRMSRHEAKRELENVRGLTHKLYNMMSDMSNNVGQQRIRVEQLTKEFNAMADEQEGNSTFKNATRDVLSGLQTVTTTLAKRLADVETELRKRTSEVDQRLSEYDAEGLLGLPTRAFLEASVDERIEDYRRRHTRFSLGIIDLDKLGETNSHYGEAAGDRLLRATVDAIKQTVGRSTVIAKVGDDEIGVLFMNCSGEAAVDKLNEAQHLASESTIAVSNGILRPAFSFGVAEYAPKEKPGALFSRCDQALSAAKENGRDRGYRHDGEDCLPVDTSTEDTATSADSDGDLDSCFAEIRERLKEVTANE